ncbi:chitobiase/beta-hexosaminidase C-terminal domain-containing protein [Paenibacillus agricola]|uniref:GH29D-like beta-sandwich domain-containing protein n=1 Tax=Paenibacillus agricola TaxID=2716264 RepID=A0ABX0J4Y1_9BACL|nr:chitobiase/beta-hexosaminidase C-terminal domain-containing protein [Paenibacillus agricola]NHN29094.1 hypothetical protein [Paenibacillus agricola]
MNFNRISAVFNISYYRRFIGVGLLLLITLLVVLHPSTTHAVSTTDFVWKHDSKDPGYSRLGDAVTKALPINDKDADLGNDRILYIADTISYVEGIGDKHQATIFKTDLVGTIESSLQLDNTVVTDIAQLTGQTGKYVIIGEMGFGESPRIPFIKIFDETTFQIVASSDELEVDELKAVVASDRLNEFMVLYDFDSDGINGFTLERYKWETGLSTIVSLGCHDEYPDEYGSEISATQLIKGINPEQYVVVGNSRIPYGELDSTSNGKVFMLAYSPASGDYNSSLSWNKEIPRLGDNNNNFHSITTTKAGNYVAVGFEEAEGEGTSNILIQPMNAVSGTLSTPVVKPFSEEYYFGYQSLHIRQTSDEGYLIGTSFSNDDYDRYGLLLKLNSLYDTEWQKTFGVPGQDHELNDLIVSGSGEPIVTGSIGTFEQQSENYVNNGFIAKLASPNANLSKISYGANDLIVSDGQYKLSVDSSVQSLDLSLHLASSMASTIVLSHTGTVAPSVNGSTLKLQSLTSGVHTVKIRVTSEDMANTKDYDIQVTVAPIPTSNADLTKIQYNTSDLLFDGSKYDLSVGSVVDNVYLKLVYAGTGASHIVTSSGGTVTSTVYDVLKISGLQAGTQTIKIRVTASDHTTTKDYDIRVTRQVELGVEQAVSAGAAQMEFEGGVNIQFNGAQIAPGAKITATLISNPPNIAGSPLKAAGKVLNFTLFGITINPNQPITLQLPVDSSANTAKVGIFYYNEATLKWEYIATQIVNGNAFAQVTHFSIYGVFESEQVALQSSTTFLANGQTEVTLTSSTSEAVIYYTLDASIPTRQSLAYNPAQKPVLNTGQVITAIAMKDGMLNSTASIIQAQIKLDISYVYQQIRNRVDTNNDGIFDRADVTYLLKLIPPYLIK